MASYGGLNEFISGFQLMANGFPDFEYNCFKKIWKHFEICRLVNFFAVTL